MRAWLLPVFGALGTFAWVAACDPKLDIKSGMADAGGGSTSGSSGSTGSSGEMTEPSDGGESDASLDASDAGDSGAPAHHIDGVNDFAAGETFATSSTSPLYQAYLAWDDTSLYLGMQGADVGSGSNRKWVMAYLEGTPGTTTGLPYNGTQQQPTLPFAAAYHLRWKTDGTYTNVQHWNGTSAWVDAAPSTFNVGHVAGSTFVEMSIARSAIGSPSHLKVHVNMLIEGDTTHTDDWTYAGVPHTSFVDGKNPTFTKYYDFDLTNASDAANGAAILPM